MTPEQLAALTDAELATLHENLLAEQSRRHDIEVIPAQIERLNARYNRAKGPAWPELPQAVEAHKSRQSPA